MPASGYSSTDTTKAHPVVPPPQSSTVVRDVAEVLASGATVAALASGISLILKPFGIDYKPVLVALSLTSAGTVAKPNARLVINGIEAADGAADAVRAQATRELYFRAAYVIAAAGRLQRAAKAGQFDAAVSRETALFILHEAARKNRLDTAASVAKTASDWGDYLGWYRDPASRSEPECIAADGNNFYASKGTTIGLPGSVHKGCNCFSGPAHPMGGMVDDAVRGVIRRTTTAKVLKLRRVA